MTYRVLILQTGKNDNVELINHLKKKGDNFLLATESHKFCQSITRVKPDYIFIDLHMPQQEWLKALRCISQRLPEARVIMLSKHADVRREMIAQEHGAKVFLRHPFSPEWIENAIQNSNRMSDNPEVDIAHPSKLPRVKIPIRVKITLPYALLAVFFALAAAFLVSRYVFESFHDRFLIQLIDTGKLTADWMVQEESRILETVRLIAHTEGVANAINNQDVERLREIIVPLMVNYSEEAIDILDLQGRSVLSLHQKPGGEVGEYDLSTGDMTLGDLPIVRKVLNKDTDSYGDKFASIARISDTDYIYIVGPIIDVDGSNVGVVAVGKSLTSLVHQIRQDTLAQVSLYDLDGNILATTLLVQEELNPIDSDLIPPVLENQDKESHIRNVSIASIDYTELLGPWEVRQGEDLGIVGTSLAQNYLARPRMLTSIQISLIVIIAVIGVITLGVFLAYQVTGPLSDIVQAAMEVAKGNLEVKLKTHGNDEVTVLSHAFNYMVAGLQEGFIYRDLLGRTVSPQVREELRQSFASGDIRLEGQNTIGTVLMSDIRGFTAISEKEEPTTILNWLNEYFDQVVPVIASHGGIVDKFEGDSMLAFFGILPVPLSPEVSAYYACKAAIDMIGVIERMNQERVTRGDPPLTTGIGVNTGTLTAGGLGTSDRMNYTVIGDTVNTTQRIEGFTHKFGSSGIVVSETTLSALKNHREEFRFEPLGEHSLKGKMEMMWLYRLYPLEGENALKNT